MTNPFKKDSYAEWEERALRELKGKSLESLDWKNSTGLDLKAYYSAEQAHRRYPVLFLEKENEWDVFEVIRVTNCETANKRALEVLNQGATGIRFEWADPETKELPILLKDIELPHIQSAFVVPFAAYPEFCLALAEFLRKRAWASSQVEGYIQADYSMLKSGKEWARVLEQYLEIIPAVSAALSGYRLLVLDVAQLAGSGLLAHQELGLALAWFNQWLSGLQQMGAGYDKVAYLWQLNLGAGQDFYTELVKFRISGHLLSLVANKYGSFKPMYLLGAGTETALSTLDRYTNLLRLTTAAQSAVLGNCSGIHLPPFSHNPEDPRPFVQRISLNIQSVLLHETGIARVKDPAAGSYFLEEMSFALAEQAWEYFLEIEQHGGILTYLNKGFLDELLMENRKQLSESVKQRKRFLLGVNQYPSSLEKTPGYTPGEEGPFEPLHLSSLFHALKQRKVKKALLLKYGDPTMRNARAGFISNFLSCGNWETQEQVWERNKVYTADVIVLCSSDEEYEQLLKDASFGPGRIFIAGMPGDKEDDYRRRGVHGFIHARSQLYNTLKTLSEGGQREKI